MSKSKSHILAIFVALSYLIGFPYAVLLSLPGVCASASSEPLVIANNAASILVMLFLITLTWFVVSRKPEWVVKLWLFGSIILSILSASLISTGPTFVSCAIIPVQPTVSQMQTSDTLILASQILMLLYFDVFGYMSARSLLAGRNKRTKPLKRNFAVIVAILILLVTLFFIKSALIH